MAEHLALRAHAALIEERLRPIEQYAAQVLEHVSLVRETRNAFESMQCDRLRHWCCPDVVRRVGVHIRQEMGTRSGAAAYDGLVHLAWERKLSKWLNVFPDTRDARAAAMKSMQAVYRVCLRKLERWLFGDNDRFAGVAAACSRFSDPLDDGGLISDWQSSELAYVVLRHALEGNQFTSSAMQWCPRLSHFIVQLDPWLREFRMIRAALVAYIWGLYSIIHSLVCDHQHWQVQDLFEGTGFAAERFVPIYRPKHAPPYLSGSGATLFPLIDGMPLWPFVRPNKPLVEIEAPQGGEQNILPVAKPSRRSWRYQRKPAPAKRRGDESLVI
jgi:hypothetical protein